MTRNQSKAALVKELRDRGIPIPEKPTIDNLTSRLSWLGGKGWILRRFKLHPEPTHPANLLEQGVMTYVPNSLFAEKIVKSQRVMIVGRVLLPPEGMPILDPTEEE